MKKRIFALALVAAIVASMFAGCKDNGGKKSGGAIDPDAKKWEEEDVTVTWWLMGGADTYYQSYWSEMKGLQAIQDSLGINIDFKVATSYDAYLPMMAAQDYPDVITAKNLERYPGRMGALFADGVSVDMTPYMDEGIMPNLKGIIEEYPNIARDLQLDSGEYTFVSTLYDIEDEEDRAASSQYGLAIRADWLEAVGKEIPTNMAEWYDVLSAFKTGDPNGNGQADEEPVCMASSGWKYFLTAYGIDDDPIVGSDGKVVYGFMTDEYKQFLTEMNKWETDGLIYNMFQQTSLEKRQERVINNFAGAWKADADHFDYTMADSYLTKLQEKAPDAKFAAVPWPETADGHQYCFSDINTFTRDTTIITSNAKKNKTDRAAAYLIDYMLSENGSNYLTWGIEGESYKVDGDEKVLLDGMDEKVAFEGTKIAAFNQYADPTTINFPTFGTVADYILSQKPDTYVEAVKTWSIGDTSYKMPAACQLSVEQEAEVEDIATDMKNYVTKQRQRFIEGKEPLTNYDTYVKNVERMGGTKYAEVWQEAYDSWQARGK